MAGLVFLVVVCLVAWGMHRVLGLHHPQPPSEYERFLAWERRQRLMPLPDGASDGEREWWVARRLAERSGEPVRDCLRVVKRLGWEEVGTWLARGPA